MNEKQKTATIAVMTDLRAFERERMTTLRSAAQLVVTMSEAHEQCGLPLHEGEFEMVSACRMVAHEGEQIAPLTRLHRRLAVFAVRHGFDWRMGGDVGNTNFAEVRRELLAAGETLPDLPEPVIASA